MNVINWNYRGTINKGFSVLNYEGYDMRQFDSSFLVLMETRTSSGDCARSIIHRIGLNFFVQDVIGHVGGIWFMWNPKDWQVDVLNNSSQFVKKVSCNTLNFDIYIYIIKYLKI